MSAETQNIQPPGETDPVGPLEEFTTDFNGDYDPSWHNDRPDELVPEPAVDEDEPHDYTPEV